MVGAVVTVGAVMAATRLRVSRGRQKCASRDKQRDHQKQAAGKLFQ